MLRGSDDCQHGIRGRVVQRHRFRREIAGGGPGDRILGHGCVEHVGRQAEMHRAGPAGRGDADGLGEVHPDRCGIRRHPGRFGNGCGHLRLAQFLEAAASELIGLGMTRQQNERGFLTLCREQRADGVGVAGSAGDPGDAGLAGQAAEGVGHVNRCGFMTDMQQLQLRIDRGIEQRHDVVAGQREDRGVTGLFQGAHNDVGAAKGRGHGGSLEWQCKRSPSRSGRGKGLVRSGPTHRRRGSVPAA